METTIIALGIFGAVMVLITVFAVAYCYKVQEKYNNLLYEYNNLEWDFDVANDTISNQYGKIKDLEHYIAKKDEEITHLNECISEYKKEILQHKNHIAELEQDNTLLGQQLAECQVPSQTTAKKETTDPKALYIANQKQWVKENNVRYGTPVKSLVEVSLFGIKKGDIGKVIKIETDYILVCFNGEIYSYYHTELEINRRKR